MNQLKIYFILVLVLVSMVVGNMALEGDNEQGSIETFGGELDDDNDAFQADGSSTWDSNRDTDEDEMIVKQNNNCRGRRRNGRK